MQTIKPWFRRLRRLIALLAVLSLLLLWSMVGHEIQDIRAKHEYALGLKADTMARAYGEVVRGRLRGLDAAMQLVRDEISQGDMAGFQRMARILRQGALGDMTVQLALIGPDGMLRYSDLGVPATPLNLSDRAHFRVHLQPGPERLYVSAPVLGRVSQRWTVQISRRLEDEAGKFSGVLVLSVSPHVLADVGPDLAKEMGEGHVLTLLKPDLTVVSRYPNGDAYLGIRLPESARAFVQAPFKPTLRRSTLDHKERMIAYQPLPELELLAGVSLVPDAMYAEIARESRGWWLAGGVLSGVILLILWGVMRYVGQREMAELGLRKERQRLDLTLTQARIGRWELDLRGSGNYWSESVFDIFGFPVTPEPPSFEDWLGHVHAADRERVRQAFLRCEDEGTFLEEEFRLLPPQGGGERTCFLRGQREMLDGLPSRICGVVMDVSDARRLQQSLQLAERRWQWAVTASRDGVWDVNTRSGEAWYSQRWKTMLGYEPEELEDSQSTWWQLLHPDDRKRVERTMAAYQARQIPFYEVEFRLKAKDGGWRWILARGQAVEWDEEGEAFRFMGTHTDITERKAMELLLSRERQRLAEAQAVAQTGSWEWDIPSGSLWWSEETFRIFGLLPGELGPSYEMFLARIHPDDRALVQAGVNDSLRGEQPYQLEHRIIRPDGTERVVYERGQIQWDEYEQPIRMVGTVQDITARKQVELAMAESEARYRSLVTAMAEGLVVQNLEGGITFCNDAACEILGLSREAMLQAASRDDRWQARGEDGQPISGEDHPAMRALRTGQPVERQIMSVLRPDGRRVWLSINARPQRLDGESEVRGVITTFADITITKEAQLHSQLAEAVVQSTSQPIVVTDGDGCIVQANPAFCLLAGYDLADIIGRPVGQIMASGQQQPDFYVALWRRLGQEGNWEGEVWNRRRTGEVVPQWLAITALRSEGGQVVRYVGIYMDITEHKRREESMWRAANFDHLTGLPNRPLLQDRLQAGLARARRLGTRLAVLFIDLDRFKEINDSHGHRVGDLVLQTVSRRMLECVREDDTLARLGGDEFMALLQNLPSAEQVEQIAAKLLAAACQPMEVEGLTLQISCSIGYVVFPDDGEEGEQLMELADQAMYQVKEHGRKGVARYRRTERKDTEA